MGDVKRPELHTARDGTQTWRVRYRHAGKESSQTFTDRRDAERFCVWIDRHGVAGALEHLDARQRSTDYKARTVADWCNEHIEGLTGVTAGTLSRYRAYVRNDLGSIADLPIDALTKRHVAAWVKGMERAGASGKTIKNKHGFLSGALAAAALDGVIPGNPAHRTRLPQSVREEMTTLSGDQVAEFLGYFDPFWAPLVETLFGTGLRWGEATALQVRDFDPETRTLSVVRSWKETGRGREIGPPKTRRSRRSIWLAPETVTVLRMQCDGKRAGDWIFTDERGGPVFGQAFHSRAWDPAVRAYEPILGRHLRVHDTRHSYASAMLLLGASISYVQAQLGHESITTTVDRYGHIQPMGREMMVPLLSQYLSPSRPELLP